jgi:hypothetical protein
MVSYFNQTSLVRACFYQNGAGDSHFESTLPQDDTAGLLHFAEPREKCVSAFGTAIALSILP